VGALVESIVVNLIRLVHQHCLAVDADGLHDTFLLKLDVKQIKVFGFHEKNSTADPNAGVALHFHFENAHTVIVACCKVVQAGVACQDPISV